MAKEDYYVVKEKGLLVLRQKRFKKRLKAGREHPHDIMAFAHNKKEMDRMIKLITGSK